MTDEKDLFFLYTLRIGEDDFQRYICKETRVSFYTLAVIYCTSYTVTPASDRCTLVLFCFLHDMEGSPQAFKL